MSEYEKQWENFYLSELPLITQENKVKAAIISINHLKRLLKRIEELEREVMFYHEIFLKNLDQSSPKQKKSKTQKFISWEEENFKNLGDNSPL